MSPAGLGHRRLEAAAGTGHQRSAAGARDGLDHLDRSALHSPAAEGGHHLQDHGAGRKGHPGAYTMPGRLV